MTENIDWDSLKKSIKVWVKTNQALPDDLYACPRCEGTGRIQVGHADPGPNPTIKCGMCNGTQMIKRCFTCRENPISSSSRSGVCDECETKRLEHLVEIEKRPEVICIFPKGRTQCPSPEHQEFNSDGNLVCDLELCEYSCRKRGVYPAECIVKMTYGEEYCKTCVDREQCPWKEDSE